jgi:hypothetical protein
MDIYADSYGLQSSVFESAGKQDEVRRAQAAAAVTQEQHARTWQTAPGMSFLADVIEEQNECEAM